MRVKTAVAITLLLVAAFGLLVWRLLYLQHTRRDEYQQRSFNQQHARVSETPRRGNIYDRRGNILAASNAIQTVFAEPRRFADPEKTNLAAMRLQEILGVPGSDICGLIYDSDNPGFVRILEDVGLDTAAELSDAGIPGIGLINELRRYYPMGRLTSHVVGFVGYEHNGLAGVELEYNSYLTGKAGHEVFLVDVGRKPLRMDLDRSSDVENGSSLVLTIDSTIQQFVHDAVARQVRDYEAESGLGIVIDPWSGEILALVSLPDYDPDAFSQAVKDPHEPLKNRALTDPYEPGSIFKPIVTAVGLDCGAIGYNDVIYCENGYFARYRIGEFLNHPYRDLSIKQIIAKSSNVGMAKIGLQMGNKNLYEGLKLFGFGLKTGIDLPGEDAGLFYPLDRWSGWSVTRIPFGHEISVTAVQILRAYCILANGGSPITPHVVKAVVDEHGDILEVRPRPRLVGHIIKPEVARWMVQTAMVEVVNDGTGDNAKLDNDIQSFGKTGTANIARPAEQGGGYDERNYIASFVGGAPAEDPELIVLVSIRKPNRSLGKGYSGGRVAAPVFKDIMEKTLRYIHPEWYPPTQVTQTLSAEKAPAL